MNSSIRFSAQTFALLMETTRKSESLSIFRTSTYHSIRRNLKYTPYTSLLNGILTNLSAINPISQ